MIDEEKPPTEAELGEAESLARALEDRAEPGSDASAIDDALAAALLLRASTRPTLSEVRARAGLNRAWPTPGRGLARAAVAALAAAASVILVLALRPRQPATLPAPRPELLRAQIAAARTGASGTMVNLDSEMSAYREQVFGALERAYGSRR
jgi:hypothetical protein